MNGIELAKNAVKRWQREHGNESLYLQCQRFDGYYIQSEWQGNWDAATYATAGLAAIAARNAGFIYSQDINDSRVKVGDRIYSDWGGPDHVMFVVGRDGNRTVVTNTANAGDDLGQLGNHVKFSHADTIDLPLIGVSRRDGRNKEIVGVELSSFGTVVTPPPVVTPPTGGDDRIKLTNWAWYANPNDAVAMRNPHGKRWTGESYLNGDYDVTGIEGNGAVRIRANDGSTVWVHPSARSAIYYTSGAAPVPNKAYFDVPASGQYYYNKYENALNGNYSANQIMYGGSREVVENPGTGPVRIRANDGSLVWVGTRNNPARVR